MTPTKVDLAGALRTIKLHDLSMVLCAISQRFEETYRCESYQLPISAAPSKQDMFIVY